QSPARAAVLRSTQNQKTSFWRGGGPCLSSRQPLGQPIVMQRQEMEPLISLKRVQYISRAATFRPGPLPKRRLPLFAVDQAQSADEAVHPLGQISLAFLACRPVKLHSGFKRGARLG